MDTFWRKTDFPRRQNLQNTSRVLTIAACAFVFTACHQAEQIAVDPPPINDALTRQMDQIAQSLVKEGFEIDRFDPRQRVLTTLPQRIPVLVDTLRFSNVPLNQVSQGAFTGLRRQVRVTHDASEGWQAEVVLQRPHSSITQLTHSATPQRVNRLTAVPDELAERRIQPTDWQPVQRDTDMEQRLEAAFLEAMTPTG